MREVLESLRAEVAHLRVQLAALYERADALQRQNDRLAAALVAGHDVQGLRIQPGEHLHVHYPQDNDGPLMVWMHPVNCE